MLQPYQHYLPVRQDLADLKWSPDGGAICAVDTVLQYQVLVYKPTGELVQTYRPYEDALGVKSLSWSPNGNLLALGSYDERARLLNNVTWQRLAECEHPEEVCREPENPRHAAGLPGRAKLAAPSGLRR